ncbi:hypothetical protein METP2_03369 [Methanosarcinales archaeon]|nr:MAG: hypothetical protein F9K14_09415 [Candidatus Methanoperedens sp.]MBZ0175941.1 hypothetical protein [Candidatus Methanoperedens nitroreducens]MCX9078875.1 hypothetical protein [Candidatus Methanoperedens sp.]MCX9086459.1 hypothetical protein [Candidatus Methanoperedens sp.]CAG1002247.1 hypothetical protein METP2_03369 [Methanosarcinales archaeon]
MILKNPYILILKLKSSIVDLSVVAVTCAVPGTWDYRAAIGIIAGIMIHGECDIINDIMRSIAPYEIYGAYYFARLMNFLFA